MKITIDTSNDSLQDLHAAAQLLQSLIARRGGSGGYTNSAPSETQSIPVVNNEMFSMFDASEPKRDDSDGDDSDDTPSSSILTY